MDTERSQDTAGDQGIRRLPDGGIEIQVRYLKPGTVLAWPTFDKEDNLVHLAYKPYQKEDIAALVSSGHEFLYYTHREFAKDSYERDLQAYLDRGAYQGPRTVSLESQKKAVSAMKEIVQFISAGQIADFSDAKGIVEYVLQDIHTSKDEFVNLLDVQNHDDYTYTHSLNVGTIAMVLAKRMKLSDQVMFNVGLGGFLHDIGKLRISNDIINKPGKLTDEEFETIKQHPRFGYEIVKPSEHVNDTVKRLILLHHEKADGTGYPFGLPYEKLGNLTFLIGIADFYDALTTDRSYKRALAPNEAVQLVMKHSISHFPQPIVQRFLAEMKNLLREGSFYEEGMYVLLNTKEVARVVGKDKLTTTRPTVEILRNVRGEMNVKPIRVDLNYDGSRTIVKILDSKETENLEIMFPT